MAEASITVDQIIEKVQKSTKLLPDELKALSPLFSTEPPDQAKAYLALSLLCQNVRKSGKQSGEVASSAGDQLQRILEPVVLEDLTETDEKSLFRGISFLTAIFRVDAEVATMILAKEGMLENIMDSVDITPSAPLSISVAQLLAEASGHKKCRAVLSPSTRKWLEVQSRQSMNERLAVACGVARVKLWQGAHADAADDEEAETPSSTSIAELATLMKRVIKSEDAGSGTVEAVEGLAYLTTDPNMKENLSDDPDFLKNLFALIPNRKQNQSTPATSFINSPLVYGIVTIVSNLTGYRPRLSDEQRQLEKLKELSKPSKTASKPDESRSILDDDQHVKIRVHRLVEAGLLPKLSVLPALTDSQAVHQNVARAFLSIVEDKDNRGSALQTGGARALQLIIRHSSPQPGAIDQSSLTLPAPLEAIQALAKLSITSSPLQVYGPDTGAIYEAIRPLSLLIVHSSSNQLQQFEGMMALTNLASHSPEVASRIANLEGFLSRVELLLFEDHVLLRRAAMELICNLVSGSEKAFEKYAGDGTNTFGVKSKLQLVLAICDVEDVPTQLAASGTLATLMNSTSACKILLELQMEKGRFIPIMTDMVLPTTSGDDVAEDVGLSHRAVICVLNLVTQNETAKLKEAVKKYPQESEKLQNALLDLVKRRETIPLPDHVLQVLLQTLGILVNLSK